MTFSVLRDTLWALSVAWIKGEFFPQKTLASKVKMCVSHQRRPGCPLSKNRDLQSLQGISQSQGHWGFEGFLLSSKHPQQLVPLSLSQGPGNTIQKEDDDFSSPNLFYPGWKRIPLPLLISSPNCRFSRRRNQCIKLSSYNVQTYL
jgi:hypothetical protein